MPVTITDISIAPGATITNVWNHADKLEPLNFSDSAIQPWKTSDGTVNIPIATFEVYRMRGTNLLGLNFNDKAKIRSASSGSADAVESHHNYFPFLHAPYSTDGVNFYALVHTEWYAQLAGGDMSSPNLPPNNNGWVTCVISMKSSDGGANWALNLVGGNHVVSAPGHVWTGTPELTGKAYNHADNHDGILGITRMLRETVGGVTYYYAMANLLLRDWSQVNIGAGQYQAPAVKDGLCLIRSTDFTNPNGWEHWVSGSTWEAIDQPNWGTFLPVFSGTPENPFAPNWFYDAISGQYVIIYCPSTSNHDPLRYVTSPSLSSPNWSTASTIGGSAGLVTDPLGHPEGDPPGPWLGFGGASYPSVLDPDAPGYSFDTVATESPWLFYAQQPGYYNNRGDAIDPQKYRNDVYRIQLAITHSGAATPVVIGNLDNTTAAGLVNGWAGDTANPPDRQTVLITVDGISVGTAVADQSRPDVHDAWPVLDGNQGFSLQIPAGAYFDGLSHSIGALVSGSHLPGSPHSFLLGAAVLGATVGDAVALTELLHRIVGATRVDAMQLSEGLGRSLIGAVSGLVGRAKGFRATSKKVIP